MVPEGVSGILAADGGRGRPDWQPSRRRLEWDNGAVAQLFSAEDPDSLRGPQFGAAWADELAKWRHAEATWDMLQFGLRLGARPRQAVTTTPRPSKLLKRLVADQGTALARMRTGDNAAHLAPGFLDTVVGRYRGARLGRQELDAEILADREDALFSRARIEAGRLVRAPEMRRIVVAVDPPAGSGREAALCGIVAAGLDGEGVVHVLADASAGGLTPTGWAHRAAALWHRLEADRLIAEANQGGDMVAAVIREVDARVPVALVHARRGKWLRAEPVAALYEQGRVRHERGRFPDRRRKARGGRLRAAREMNVALQSVLERGDLAHLALFLWASGASGLSVWALKELARSNRRFEDFVTEISRVTRLLGRE